MKIFFSFVFIVHSFCIYAQELKIGDIQGEAHLSTYDGKEISNLVGIVTFVVNTKHDKGFYLQDITSDNNPFTSDAIFVRTDDILNVRIGNKINVKTATVKENYLGGKSKGNLSNTELKNANFTNLNGNYFKEILPVIIGENGLKCPNIIDDDTNGEIGTSKTHLFDTPNDAIDFYESLEGMLVNIEFSIVVGSTVLSHTGNKLYFNIYPFSKITNSTINGGIFLEQNNSNPQRLTVSTELSDNRLDFPIFTVGDQLKFGASGCILYYSFSGDWRLSPIDTTSIKRLKINKIEHLKSKLKSDKSSLTYGCFNVENLDANDNPQRFKDLASVIVNNMNCPDILSLEEIQDEDGTKKSNIVSADKTFNLLINEIFNTSGEKYLFTQINPENGKDGGEPGGNIRVGVIYKSSKVKLIQNPTQIPNVDSVFKDTRKSLVCNFEINGKSITVITNHLSSKYGDMGLFSRFQPPTTPSENERIAQAKIINLYVKKLLTENPNANIIVAGDMNDFDFSEALSILKSDILINAISFIPQPNRYSYVFQGNAQVLDHILISKNLSTQKVEIDMIHVNADFIEKSSDHNPVLMKIPFK